MSDEEHDLIAVCALWGAKHNLADSVKDACDTCGVAIGYDPRNAEIYAKGGYKFRCMDCTMKRITEDEDTVKFGGSIVGGQKFGTSLNEFAKAMMKTKEVVEDAKKKAN